MLSSDKGCSPDLVFRKGYCPNCQSELQISIKRKISVCPFCGKEFESKFAFEINESYKPKKENFVSDKNIIKIDIVNDEKINIKKDCESSKKINQIFAILFIGIIISFFAVKAMDYYEQNHNLSYKIEKEQDSEKDEIL